MKLRIKLPDGSSWPVVGRGSAALDGKGPSSLDDDAPIMLTQAEFFDVRETCAAYDHLLAHPSGVEQAIRKLRMLRRGAR